MTVSQDKDNISKLAQLQKGVNIKDRHKIMRKYNGMSITEALETAKQGSHHWQLD